MNLEKLIDTAIELQNKDEKTQEAFDWLFEIVAGGSYSPFIEISTLDWFIKCLEIVNNELADDISWFLYEITIPNDDWYNLITKEWVEYKIYDKESFLQYLTNEYGNSDTLQSK
jgi:hypothetical protein